MPSQTLTIPEPEHTAADARATATQLMAAVAQGADDPRELADQLAELGLELRLDGYYEKAVVDILRLGGWTYCETNNHYTSKIRAVSLASPRPDPMTGGTYHRVRVEIQAGHFLGAFTHLELSRLTEREGKAVH